MKKSTEEVSWEDIKSALYILTMPKLLKLGTFLTKYFPFSVLISEDRVFHYKNKRANDIWNLIRDPQHYVEPFFRHKDEQFYFLFYSNKGISKKEIEEKLINENVFISENEGVIKVLIPRD